MMNIVRQEAILRAVQHRISRQGDMPIRINVRTLDAILRMLGLSYLEFGDDQFREVDAIALDALRRLAWQRL